MSELSKRTPVEYDVDGMTLPGVTASFLGVNADFSTSKLMPYVDMKGIQVHPDRIHLSNTLRFNVELGEKR